MSKSTPGPWKAEWHLETRHPKDRPQWHVEDGAGCIADVYDGGANARLIAAAPDLLDVVRNVGGIDDGWLKGAHPELLRKAILQIRDEARAAIAKVEGVS